MENALYIAQIILALVLTGLVMLQTRAQGMQNRDSSSIYRTRRGLEKTLFQATIAVSVMFLLLSIVNSLPIFGAATPAV
ncbi:MAG: preprotein translocase subunit SecG [Chloroflexales bacterium]|nr:preprotein translocase subunit SecG [Chloroflexales bacterium]